MAGISRTAMRKQIEASRKRLADKKKTVSKPGVIFIEFSRHAPITDDQGFFRRLMSRLFGTYFFTVANEDIERLFFEAIEDAIEIGTEGNNTLDKYILNIFVKAWSMTISADSSGKYAIIDLETGVQLIFRRKLVADSRRKDAAYMAACGFPTLAENILAGRLPIE